MDVPPAGLRARPCAACPHRRGRYLHRGRLYCQRCLPAHELDPMGRYAFVLTRCAAIQAELRERRARPP